MNRITFTAMMSLFTLSIFGQIPNGSFEDWNTIFSIEEPTSWRTNNKSDYFLSVTKTKALTDGKYAMQVVNKGYSFEGYSSGSAWCTFTPNNSQGQLNLTYLVDSISGGASIEILILRYNQNRFELIDSWYIDSTSNGIQELHMPFSFTNRDSIKIEIRANSVSTPTGLEGYAKIIVDKMHVGSTSSIVQTNNQKQLEIYPNPTTGLVYVGEYNMGKQYKLHDTKGRVIASGIISKRTLEIGKEGLYILNIRTEENKWISKKILVEK